MIKKRLSILFTSAMAVLALSACDNGDGAGKYPSKDNLEPTRIPDGPTPTPEPGVDPTPEPTSAALSGTAAKGLIIGGVVNVHPIVNGAVVETPLTTFSTTDENGNYLITVPDYDGGPVVVRVTTSDNTQMVCDLPDGCGEGQPFGSRLSLNDPSFNLDAVVASLPASTTTEPVSVNVSVLTDTATSVALDNFSKLSDTSSESIAAAINNANSSVANRFGVIGQLTSLPVVDLTNPAALANVDQATLEYNLLSAAVVDALLSGNSDATIASAVASFTEQYVQNGGLADTETDASIVVTLAEILAQARQVIDAIQAQDTENTLDLGQLEAIISNNQSLAEVGSTEPTNGVPTDGNASDLELVKSMVDSVRTLASVNLTDTEQFIDEIEVASQTFDADAGAHFQALAWAAEAMVSAGSAYDSDDTLTSHTDENTGIDVGISADDEGKVTYTITEAVITVGEGEEAAAITLELEAVDASSEITNPEAELSDNEDGSKTTTENASGNISLVLTGTSKSSAVMLTINDGELSGSGGATEVDTDGIPAEGTTMTSSKNSADADLSAFNLAADVTLEELVGENPIRFEGTLNFEIEGLAIDRSETKTYVSSNDSVSLMAEWSESVGFDQLVFSASGSFNSAAGNALLASLSVTATPKGMVYSCHSGDSAAEQVQAKTCTEESESEYLGMSFSVMVKLDATALEDEISLSVSGTRSGLSDADLVVRIESGATMLQFDYATADFDNAEQSVSITNESGVVLSAGREMVEGEYVITGNIVLNEVEYATIEEVRSFTAIRYIDGFNETF